MVIKTLIALLAFVSCVHAQTNAPFIINNGQPQIALNVSPQYTCIAPCAKFFQATGTTTPESTNSFADVLYSWNFGDENAETWTTGSNPGTSKNIAYGPVAAYIYKSAGQYNACLAAYDGVNTNNICTVITVLSANSEFSGTNTICVDYFAPTPGADGCPAGAAVIGQNDFCAAITSNLNPGKRILFKRGRTFFCATKTTINKSGPWIIAAYGSGTTRTVVLTQQLTGSIIEIGAGAGVSAYNGKIFDVEFTQLLGSTVNAIFTVGNFNDLTLLNLHIDATEDGIQFYAGQINVSGNTQIWKNWAIADSTIENIAGGGATHGIYGMGREFAIIGNTLANNVNSEHLIRLDFCNKCVISNNDLSLSANAKESIALRGVGQNPAETSYYFQYVLPTPNPTQYNVISSNKISINAFTGVKIGPVNNTVATVIKDTLLENNWYFVTPPLLSVVNSLIVNQGEYTTIRNEILNATNATRSEPIDLLPASSGMTAANNVNIYNNSMYSGTDNSGNVTLVIAGAGISNVTVKNNIGYFPAETGTTAVTAGTGSAGVTTSNNSTDSTGTNQIKNNNPFNTATPVNPIDFNLSPGSYAINAGTNVPVWTDFYMQPRTGTYDLGALNP